jgi:hypothetical protein
MVSSDQATRHAAERYKGGSNIINYIHIYKYEFGSNYIQGYGFQVSKTQSIQSTAHQPFSTPPQLAFVYLTRPGPIRSLLQLISLKRFNVSRLNKVLKRSVTLPTTNFESAAHHFLHALILRWLDLQWRFLEIYCLQIVKLKI